VHVLISYSDVASYELAQEIVTILSTRCHDEN